MRLSPDHSLLLVADTATRWVWSFQTQPDGSLAYGLAFHRLEMEDEVGAGQMRSGADGFTVDNEGFLYVCTRLGVQVSDPAGRTSAVLVETVWRRTHRTRFSPARVWTRSMSRREIRYSDAI